MNRPISRLFVVVIVLFGLLIVWTSRWTVFDASALQGDKLNHLAFFATEKVKRGRLLTDDGHVLARSVAAGGGTWSRSYPTAGLTAQAVGYANIAQGQEAGLESTWLQQLEGRQQTQLTSVFGPISESNTGDDVDTTLDLRGQTLARSLLAGRLGSVVAIDPRSGAIRAMYSNPTYDNNQGPNARCGANALSIGCQTDLATQGEFPPGSTFKVVTTAAALDSGRYTPNSMIDGRSPLTVSGAPLHNDNNDSYGQVSLSFALTNSINTVYAQVGEALGARALQTYMERFGFYSRPQLDIPTGEMISSGERVSGKLTPVTSPTIDLGRTAIGQANLAVTPMQMAEVASAVADHGILMRPHFVTKVVNPDGVTVQTVAPTVQSHVMGATAATELAQMMTKVVEEGTGQKANLGGLSVAGKTGTATISPPGVSPAIDDAWFIGFAPVKNPKIAVAVVLPHIPNGYGGTYAAPVAADMMKQLLNEGL
jgi:penicillin-binding protein A